MEWSLQLSYNYLGAVEIFILNKQKNKVLLMRRNHDREVLPGYYAGIGGKMDAVELENPEEAALRELFEESGISRKDLISFELKAVITVKDRHGRWFVFQFAGVLTDENFPIACDLNEGVIEWIHINKLKDIKLIPDLQQGILEKLLFSPRILLYKSLYNDNDQMIKVIID